MTNDKSPEIKTWFTSLTADQNKIAEDLRTIILEFNSNFQEDIKWKMPNYSLNKLVCYLQKSKTHMTLGFQQGAHLNDPNGYLQGTGKDMRHIKIAIDDEIDSQKVRFLIEEAIIYDKMNS